MKTKRTFIPLLIRCLTLGVLTVSAVPYALGIEAQTAAPGVTTGQETVQIHSDRQDFFRDGRVIYKGNVSLRYGIFQLTADEIIIKTAKGKEWFIATGNPATFATDVPANDEKSLHAQAQTIEFSAQSDTLVLSQAILTSGRHKIEGETIEYNLISGQFSASKAKTTRYGVKNVLP